MKKWTPQEIEYLKNNLKKDNKALSLELNRTVKAIYSQKVYRFWYIPKRMKGKEDIISDLKKIYKQTKVVPNSYYLSKIAPSLLHKVYKHFHSISDALIEAKIPQSRIEELESKIKRLRKALRICQKERGDKD